MKLPTFLFCLLFITSIVSCDNDNETSNIEGPIIAKWSLTKFEPGYSPIENFSNSEVIWEFKNNGTLIVSVDPSISSKPILEPGEYSYLISENKITINNLDYDYLYENSNNKLIIHNDPASDGFRLSFVLNE